VPLEADGLHESGADSDVDLRAAPTSAGSETRERSLLPMTIKKQLFKKSLNFNNS
jgi:hypothetical protein